jgi:predicted ATPase
MKANLPSGTVTFLFTDVEGSTELLQALGPQSYADALAMHRRVVRSVFARHGGTEVDTQGDAFFIAFPTASGAVTTARETLLGLAPGPIRIRIGIHTGTPHVTEEGYVGRDVHLAARIAAAAHGGQVLLSANARDLVDDEVSDLGEHRLKDFSQAVRIFQLGAERFPPLRTISNTNLPRSVSPLIGREEEMAEVIGLLHGGARLVTLTGTGGTGKTRLAIEAAAAMVSAFKAGVFWVGLAEIRDASVVVEVIARTLGARGSLADHVGERALMLLLDNFEQVAEAAPALAALASSCPNLQLLVTSRELLRVKGEVEYAVPPLAEAEAVQLFRARSGVGPDPAIGEICRRLDNLPLAVELAAARTSILTPAQILARLSERLDLFTGGRDADVRQQTLRATISWSHELLDDREQQLFARLAVFDGGSSLQAAEEVCGADLDPLQALVQKSLVRRTGERFWMLETIHEFAAERFSQLGDAEDIRQAHAEWFCALGAAANLRGPDYSAWLERLRADHANFGRALGWLSVNGHSEAQVRLASDLSEYAHLSGALVEGRRWLEEALASRADGHDDLYAGALAFLAMHAAFQGDVASAARYAEEGIETAHRANAPAALGEALRALAVVRGLQGYVDESTRLSTEGLQLARKHGLAALQADLANNLGYSALESDDLVHSEQLLTESLAVGRAHDDPVLLSAALANLGVVAFKRGSVVDAARLWREALDIARRDQLGVLALAPLVGVAALMAVRGRHRRSAQVVGAVDELADRIGEPFQTVERGLREQALKADVEALGEDQMTRALAAGRVAGMDHALVDAGQWLDEVQDQK